MSPDSYCQLVEEEGGFLLVQDIVNKNRWFNFIQDIVNKHRWFNFKKQKQSDDQRNRNGKGNIQRSWEHFMFYRQKAEIEPKQEQVMSLALKVRWIIFFQFKLAFHAFSILILNMCHLNLFWVYDICQLNFKHMIYAISICSSNKLISGRMCWVGRKEISQGSNSDHWTFAALATVLIIDLFCG